MYWPSPQEYNEAIQTPAISFADPELKTATVALTPIGIPRALTGAFASVYKMSTGDGDWAVRCFLTNRPEQEERYRRISEFVSLDELDATVEFHYIKQGIRVHGSWYPILKMEWVNGDSFDNYLSRIYRDRARVEELAARFRSLVRSLDDAGIAHGDLQHGNMIICSQAIKLVDYDALYVPSLAGKQCLEIGHPNYQHPLRTASLYDTTVDNFSCWLIDASLTAVSIDPELYERFSGGDECILIRRGDLKSPEKSPVFEAMLTHQSDTIRENAALLVRMLWANPSEIPELHARKEELDILPSVKPEEKVKTKKSEYSLDEDDNPDEAPLALADITGKTRFQADSSLSGGDLRLPSLSPGLQRTSLTGWIRQAGETILRSLEPLKWIEWKASKADTIFSAGRYKEALGAYQDAYREAQRFKDTYPSHVKISPLLLRVATRLGYCYSLGARNLNLATNYFFVAYKESEALSRHERESSMLLLSVSRFLKGEEQEALRLFDQHPEILADMRRYLVDEVDNRQYIERPEVLALLFKVQAELSSKEYTEELGDFFSVCLEFYQRIKNRTTTSLDRKCAFLYLARARANYKAGDTTVARKNILQAIEIAELIWKKEGRDESVMLVLKSRDFRDVLEKVGITPRKSAIDKDMFAIVQALELLEETASIEELKSLMVELEKKRYRKLSECLALHFKSAGPDFDYPGMLEWAYEKRLKRCIHALIESMVDSPDPVQVATFFEFLAARSVKSEIDKFLNYLESECSDRFALSVAQLLSVSAYRRIYKRLEPSVITCGDVNDVIRHLRFVGTTFGFIEVKRFVADLVKVRRMGLILDLTFALLDMKDDRLAGMLACAIYDCSNSRAQRRLLSSILLEKPCIAAWMLFQFMVDDNAYGVDLLGVQLLEEARRLKRKFNEGLELLRFTERIARYACEEMLLDSKKSVMCEHIWRSYIEAAAADQA